MLAFRLLYFIIFSFLPFLVDEGEEKIEWTSDKKLSWSDFKGPIDKESKHEATTHTRIYMACNMETSNTVKVEVRNYFICNLSWHLPEQVGESVLKHEQGHFDLSEILARRIRKKCSMQKPTSMKDLQKWVNSIYKRETENSVREQQRYDDETRHSVVKVIQERWNNQIEKQLIALEKYSSPEFTVELAH